MRLPSSRLPASPPPHTPSLRTPSPSTLRSPPPPHLPRARPSTTPCAPHQSPLRPPHRLPIHHLASIPRPFHDISLLTYQACPPPTPLRHPTQPSPTSFTRVISPSSILPSPLNPLHSGTSPHSRLPHHQTRPPYIALNTCSTSLQLQTHSVSPASPCRVTRPQNAPDNDLKGSDCSCVPPASHCRSTKECAPLQTRAHPPFVTVMQERFLPLDKPSKEKGASWGLSIACHRATPRHRSCNHRRQKSQASVPERAPEQAPSAPTNRQDPEEAGSSGQ